MSRTYKYPRESLDDDFDRKEKGDVRLRIQRKLERKRHQKKNSRKISHAFRKFVIGYRDR